MAGVVRRAVAAAPALSSLARGAGAVARSQAAAPARRGAKGRGWLQRYYEQLERDEAQEADWKARPALPPVAQGAAPRPRAFLDFERDSEPIGRVTVELAADLLPKTVDNFLRLCKGTTAPVQGNENVEVGYKGNNVHQIFRDRFISMGDIFHGDGTGGHSALGVRNFEDEGFFVSHTKPGILSMANGGVDQNNSVFFVTLKPLPHLNGRNVAFGAVVEGMDVLQKINKEFIVKGKPITPIKIRDCGVLES